VNSGPSHVLWKILRKLSEKDRSRFQAALDSCLGSRR
jgi:hypothetical protein